MPTHHPRPAEAINSGEQPKGRGTRTCGRLRVAWSGDGLAQALLAILIGAVYSFWRLTQFVLGVILNAF